MLLFCFRVVAEVIQILRKMSGEQRKAQSALEGRPTRIISRIDQQPMAGLIALIACCILCATGCRNDAPGSSESEDRADSKENKASSRNSALTDRLLSNAEQLIAEEQFSKAIDAIEEISNPNEEQKFHADTILARAFRAQGRLWDAQKRLESILSGGEIPEPEVVSQLIRLCSMTNQRQTAARWLEKLQKENGLSFEETVLWTDFDRRHPAFLPILEKSYSASPDDPGVLLGLAGEDVSRGDNASAMARTQKALALAKRFSAAYGMLGEILVETHPEQLLDWYNSIPADLRTAPEVQIALGRWAERADDPEVAARCFWEASRKIEGSFRIQNHLARVLSAANHESASVYREVADDTFEMRQALSRVLNSPGGDAQSLVDVVKLLRRTGRTALADIWFEIGRSRYPEVFSGLKTDDEPRRLPSLESLPAFDLSRPRIQGLSKGPADASTQSRIRFEDSGEILGMNFNYHHGRPPGSRKIRMFESTGGGVAVADIDGDDLPDVLLTQGVEWPEGATTPVASSAMRDVLYRNRRTHFAECSSASNVALENGYGQGCAAGDVNNDGFADLYIANIGKNRLLINNGDGTFSETHPFDSAVWTTSCMIADLDFDSVPDLFDVNYLSGKSVLTDHCNVHRCSVLPYAGEPDMVNWGAGDLSFASQLITAEGRGEPGLGLVAFPENRLNGNAGDAWKRGLTIFVGNDGRPDLLLTPVKNKESSDRSFVNEAILRGVAVNGNGRATSSMGIAVEDINFDGTADLLVTNYSGEPNSLFTQSGDGFFMERSAHAGLATESVPYVGWGSQFFDADMDGVMDLIVANGHVADFADGATYQMPLQMFQGVKSDVFVSVSQSAGKSFENLLMGRAIALLDWNCDGRRDCVVGAIDGPSRILTNRSESQPHFCALKLHGVASSRDAVGSVVRLQAGEMTQTLTLFGGSGYQASNELLLLAAIPEEASRIERLEVFWPSGNKDEYADVPVNARLHLVEGRGWKPAE